MGTIGERVRAAREAAGLSRAELARRSGLPEATISRVEAGKRENPNSDTIRAIALALGASTDVLLGVINYNPDEYVRALLALGVPPAVLIELLAYIRDIDITDWEDFIALAKRRADKRRAAQERQQGRGHPRAEQQREIAQPDHAPDPPSAPAHLTAQIAPSR